VIQPSPLSFFFFNLRQGQATDYARYFEYPKAVEMMEIEEGESLSLLDVGSGRQGQFPLYLAAKFPQLSVCSSDPREDFTEQRQRVEALGLRASVEAGRLRFEQMDILSPVFPEAHFDRISCISTIEHIPGDGDTAAIRNMARLLKPGGLLVVSVPFNWYHSGEIYREEPMYSVPHSGRQSAPGDRRCFFERVYDDPSLRQRLVEPSGLSLEKMIYFGEPGFSFGRFIHRGYWNEDFFPRCLLKLRLIQLFIPLISPVFLKVIEANEFDAEDWSGVGLIMSLRKNVAPSDVQ